MPQNKFEVLRSRIMQCGVEERVVKSMRMAVVKCFRCGGEGHKCRECPQKEKKEYKVVRSYKGKAHQERKLVRLTRGKAQECREKEVRRVEEGGRAARPVKGEAQQGWWRSSTEELRKRAEKHCGKGVPEETRLLELGWMTEETVVSYLTCKCGEKGCHVEDNQGQGVIPF